MQFTVLLSFCGSAARMCGMALPFRQARSLPLAAAPLLDEEQKKSANARCRCATENGTDADHRTSRENE